MAEKPANRDPWPLLDQFAACGLDAPMSHRNGWAFQQGKLFAHLCAQPACPDCLAAQAKGWRTVRLTPEMIRDGRALDVVAKLLWKAPVQGDLFS